MAKIGSTKVCKARVSTTHKKKCENRYKVNHRMQKFCSNKCRNRNNRITKSDRLKKEKKISAIASKKSEYIKTFRGQIDLGLVDIKNIYDKMYDCMNLVEPVIKKKDKYSSEKREIYEMLKNEFKIKNSQIPHFKNMLEREVINLAVLLASKWKELEGDDENEVKGIIERVEAVISSDYYEAAPDLKDTLKGSLNKHGYYSKDIDFIDFSNLTLAAAIKRLKTSQ